MKREEFTPFDWIKGFSSKFQKAYRVWLTPEDGHWVQQVKCCEYNNKNEHAGLNIETFNTDNSSFKKLQYKLRNNVRESTSCCSINFAYI